MAAKLVWSVLSALTASLYVRLIITVRSVCLVVLYVLELDMNLEPALVGGCANSAKMRMRAVLGARTKGLAGCRGEVPSLSGNRPDNGFWPV